MGAKKKLIARLALWAGSVLVLAVAGGVIGLLVNLEGRQRFADERKREQRQRIEDSRAYLAELAKRIGKLPVDATLVSEIESRYFEEREKGPLYVWAMDTKGDFIFGVPQSAFHKLNALYDREVTPRLKEGVFLDRQTFLLGLVDDSDEISPEPDSGDTAQLVERGERWRADRWEPEGSFVLSTPLKTADGGALGSLYLKRKPARQGEYYREDERVKGALAAAGTVAAAAFAFLWILLPTWVYVDARERGARRGTLFAFLTVISSLVGLVVYLITRPESTRTLACPGCGREVNGGAFCPHCGRDLSQAFCPACRYPLKADWAYCPACRTEVKPQGAGTPVTEAG
jgi:hypothetical protein